jgi:hypothetical protein
VPNETNFTYHCGQGCWEKKQAKYLNNISSNTRIIHILVNTPTKVNIFPGSEGVNSAEIGEREREAQEREAGQIMLINAVSNGLLLSWSYCCGVGGAGGGGRRWW